MMSRRNFISKSCAACATGTFLSAILSSCSPTKYVQGNTVSDGLSVSLDAFLGKENSTSLPFIIAHHDSLEYPIYVFRASEKEYRALWMKCSHQGSELQASGDHLYCPSHGSEFDSNGNVTQGPAEQNLRTFPVTVNDKNLLIKLS